jgi:hypothetical protein
MIVYIYKLLKNGVFRRLLWGVERHGRRRINAPGNENGSGFEPFIYLKTIILPRQARDKHRESTQKRLLFFV